MKNLIIKTVSGINTAWLSSRAKGDFSGSTFFRVSIRSVYSNNVRLVRSDVSKTVINVDGAGNSVTAENIYIDNSIITITGQNNELILEEGVILRGAKIVLRGDNCKITIGKRTTFGGVRIVNVGSNNTVSIGEDCLFADQIEIWASDTHSIYDQEGNWINREKPVEIGNKVWVGSRAIILKGVKINNGSIIGMGAVITKDVPAAVIMAGSPQKQIKENVSWDINYGER